MHWHRLLAVADIEPGEIRGARIGEREFVVCRTATDVHVLDALCSHAEARLDEGWLKGDKLYCPMHGAAFDVRSGLPLSRPATRSVCTYPTRIQDGQIEVA